RLDKDMAFQPFSLKLFHKAVDPPGTLPLPSGKGRRDKRHVFVSQIQKMPCHQTPHHGIVLVDRVNRGRLFFVANDNKRDLERDRKSTRLNSSHVSISYAVFCLKKKKH